MNKKNNSHIFSQHPILVWQWVSYISFALVLAASVGAFFSARSWVSEGKYLQSIDGEQIEVLRLIPFLKELQQQANGPVSLEPAFFANLKKAEIFLKSATADMKNLPELNPNSESAVSIKGGEPTPLKPASSAVVAPTMKNSNAAKDAESSAPLLPLSENPVIALFQRLDSKVMAVVFGKPEKYAVKSDKKNDDEKPEQIEPAEKLKKNPKPSTPLEVLVSAKNTERAIGVVIAQEKSLNDLVVLAKSGEVLIGPKGPLELDKLPLESAVKKYAESISEYVKAYNAWQKNATDIATSIDLQKALTAVIEQKVILEIDVGKKTAGKSNLKLTDVAPKMPQTPWYSKLPQESASVLNTYVLNMRLIKEFANDYGSLRLAAQKKSQSIEYFDFKSAGGFLGLTLVSIIAAFGIILGTYMALMNTRRNAQDLQRASKQTRAASQLLKTIDLGFASAPNNETFKSNSQSSDPDQSSDQLNVKTVMNVISELSDDLKNKIKKIDTHFKVLSQLNTKLRHSIDTLHEKSGQIRTNTSDKSSNSPYSQEMGISRGGPLDQLQDAFSALKQQGVRLYLAILDNHSSKQLAVETEQLNLLVERVEATVSKMRSTLASALEQASPVEVQAPQISLEAIELLSMDAKQVMRDLQLWQVEFDGLNKAFTELKREARV
jgi:tRNA U55 pseudouridine synthase TruB